VWAACSSRASSHGQGRTAETSRHIALRDNGPWVDDEDPGREMTMAVDIPLERLLADYRASCDQHREIAAGLGLNTPSRGELSWRAEPVTLRWILFI
jgi:hypothetical protein